jgi:hypothetical protein
MLVDPSPSCLVCHAHDVPMSPRTTGEVELWLCDDPAWCQVRAAANIMLDSLNLTPTKED